jgi:hypothetical protein
MVVCALSGVVHIAAYNFIKCSRWMYSDAMRNTGGASVLARADATGAGTLKSEKNKALVSVATQQAFNLGWPSAVFRQKTWPELTNLLGPY